MTQPRQPCKTLAIRYNKTDFVKFVVQSGFTGWYLRVLEEGQVKQGDTCTLEKADPAQISISFANQILHHDRKNKEGIKQVLGVQALSTSWQETFGELLNKLESVGNQ